MIGSGNSRSWDRRGRVGAREHIRGRDTEMKTPECHFTRFPARFVRCNGHTHVAGVAAATMAATINTEMGEIIRAPRGLRVARSCSSSN